METWMPVVFWVAGLLVLDKGFAWMERRGWIYWRGREAVNDPRPVPLLRRCSDCGYEVSARAVACPSCGRVMRLQWFVLAGLLIAVLSALFSRAADALLAAWS